MHRIPFFGQNYKLLSFAKGLQEIPKRVPSELRKVQLTENFSCIQNDKLLSFHRGYHGFPKKAN